MIITDSIHTSEVVHVVHVEQAGHEYGTEILCSPKKYMSRNYYTAALRIFDVRLESAQDG